MSEANWRTKDGDVISINELTDSHLTNIINYLCRQSTRANHWDYLSWLSASESLQGEAALASIGDEPGDYERPLDWLKDDPKWPPLIAECEKRGIQWKSIYQIVTGDRLE
jgi:hypothetical protein